MKLLFITGNKGKLAEAQMVIPEIEQKNIDLPEIQELDIREVVRVKLEEAIKHVPDDVGIIIEDTSVVVDHMNGLPGPLIKWFLQSLGLMGIWGIVENFPTHKATATSMIGYREPNGIIHYCGGSTEGVIVSPRGESFGWDPLFLPDGCQKTFGEMSPVEKSETAMRTKAFRKLKEIIDLG